MLAELLWGFVDGRPVRNHWRSPDEVPASTTQSEAMRWELKRRGFKLIGSTTCCALIQAVDMVNDHAVDCFRHRQVDTA